MKEVTKDFIEKYYLEKFRGDDAHGIAHSRRVLAIARRLDISRDCNNDALTVCAYFHDIVSFKKGSLTVAKRAKTASLNVVEEFFKNSPRLKSIQDIVFDCVDSHSYSSRRIPIYLEGKVIQDADKIEALGYIGIARLFMVAGKMGTLMMDNDDPLALERVPNDRKFAIDHIFCKLRNLPNEMNTSEGKKIATARLSKMEGFIDELLTESKAYR